MTRKNYKSLVKILARNNINFDDHAELIGSIMSWFKEDNINFCKITFENALKEELKTMSKPFKKDAITDSELVNMLTQIDLYFNQCNMINDADMMKDCYLLAKDDFLNKYRWISEEEYNASLERFKFE